MQCCVKEGNYRDISKRMRNLNKKEISAFVRNASERLKA